jgi:hypothetical protein
MSNRLVRLRVQLPFIVNLCIELEVSHFICNKGLPLNCKIERFVPVLDGTYQGSNSIDIILSHPSFRELHKDELIAIVYPEFTKVE